MEAPPVQYVTTSDGYRIAYCVSGDGPPLVLISPDYNNTQQLWQFQRPWMEGLARRFQLIQYDPRGQGMSTRRLPDGLTQDDYVRDLEAVADKVGVASVLIWGFAGKSHTAIRFATRHPERVTALILNSPAASGQAWGRALFVELPNEDWERFLHTQVSAVFAGLTREGIHERVREMERSVTLEDFTVYMRSMVVSNVEKELPRLTMPVLIMHPRESFFSAEEPMKVAALAPNARFVPLDGDYFTDSVPQALEVTDRFVAEVLSSNQSSTPPALAGSGLSHREVEVLRLIAAGKSNAQIADELVISQNTVIRHVSNIFGKIGAANRAEAASYATRNGIV
ncbi:MAG TPA: alpha/beta fold hydrolase [Dehalococcoidia bacterium]|jgi:pimeloyl-ACP methyl ester carboxylesterase/DNA-binding CsgD family transcriptional regulator